MASVFPMGCGAWASKQKKAAFKLQRLFYHLQGDTCENVTVSPLGGFVDHSACKFSLLNEPAEPEVSPGESAPAA